jgi:uracil phosphoribosyltransferase
MAFLYYYGIRLLIFKEYNFILNSGQIKAGIMVFNLSEYNSIASQFLFELREHTIQRDRLRFRKNLARLGEILAYEISKEFSYETISIETAVSKAVIKKVAEMPVLITILRAGLPFVEGFLNFFDHSNTGFIGAYRAEGKEAVEINMDYVAIPPLKGKEVILIDPMLATGSSVIKTLDIILGELPRRIHVASVIASPEGIENLNKYKMKLLIPLNIWTGAIDQKLNDQFYIIPGLGDAGDLSFGTK